MKNDTRDAEDLAELLRLGRLAEAWIAPPEVRELREIVRPVLLSDYEGVFDVAFIGSHPRRRRVLLSVYNVGPTGLAVLSSHPSVSPGPSRAARPQARR